MFTGGGNTNTRECAFFLARKLGELGINVRLKFIKITFLCYFQSIIEIRSFDIMLVIVKDYVC